MLEYDEFRLRLVGMEGSITELKESLDIAGTIEEIKKLYYDEFKIYGL